MLALVNTIMSGNIKEFSVKGQVNKFYTVIDKIFKLEYGNILLASSSKKDLQNILDNEWPFLTNYTEMVKQCLLLGSCKSITDLVTTFATTGEQNIKNIKYELNPSNY